MPDWKCKGFSLLGASIIGFLQPVEWALRTELLRQMMSSWHSFAKIYLGVTFIEERKWFSWIPHTLTKNKQPCWNWQSTWPPTIKAFGLLAVAQNYEKYLIFKNTQWYHTLAAGSKTVQLNSVYLKCSAIVYFTNANSRNWGIAKEHQTISYPYKSVSCKC